LDFKFLSIEPTIFSASKIVQLDPNFVYPNNRNCLGQEWRPEKHQCLGCRGSIANLAPDEKPK
jgi:hypothetical protein